MLLFVAGVLGTFIVIANAEEWAIGIWLGGGVGGALVSIITGFFLYAFGQLVDDVHDIRQK